jgi:hypothetical protein
VKLPQLSLRELFWLVLVCALAVGWWVDSSRRTVDRSKLLEAIQKAGFRLVIDENYLLERSWPRPNDHNWFTIPTISMATSVATCSGLRRANWSGS